MCVFKSGFFFFVIYSIFPTYTLMSFRVQLTFYFGNILEYIYFNFGDVPQLALSFSMIDWHKCGALRTQNSNQSHRFMVKHNLLGRGKHTSMQAPTSFWTISITSQKQRQMRKRKKMRRYLMKRLSWWPAWVFLWPLPARQTTGEP